MNGAAWYAQYGTEKSRGTKVFALAGAVNNTGLVEVPMGTPLGDIVFNVGGGIKNKKKYKAAQLGGPSAAASPFNTSMFRSIMNQSQNSGPSWVPEDLLLPTKIHAWLTLPDFFWILSRRSPAENVLPVESVQKGCSKF